MGHPILYKSVQIPNLCYGQEKTEEQLLFNHTTLYKLVQKILMDAMDKPKPKLVLALDQGD